MDVIVQAFGLVATWNVVLTVLVASIFALFVGAIPGLTATMATAMLVPLTFFMEPVAAVGAIVACSAMAIFAGDIPAALLRIPGTPASAAYAEETYRLTKKGQAELALGACVLFSAIGGLFGTLVLIFAAPALAEFAMGFSSQEYFWMALLGLTCAVAPVSGPRNQSLTESRVSTTAFGVSSSTSRCRSRASSAPSSS
jgi:TctA family transporter